ncbi:MAG: glycosyltransferase family 2 protein [Patescibacteria group bacterium]|nr:glycosyltransferase family 2 protein [Patescibacteria group bacterium]MBU1160488.1 glycosyltransferase family 2 protein [Patescibacteria group bacterium]MBU1684505.1 glycosyltransferase family 2 protein [Patescibacteria group bacterium]MBU1778318.1 glycosyltransferase family 2 protein [Patescibacteria group bacterium]MBU1987345.1 glycosyltransferase family 2 protein [Patescibacteria group bacterium]
MDLSIIIVNYKSKEKTLNCIQSIKESDLDNLKYEIIVVDNASQDDSQKIITLQYPEINFIQSEKNLGMGGGNNLGIKQTRGEFILILNPDTTVKKDAIKTLYNYIKNNEKVGIVGPKLLNPDNTLQYSCFRFPKFYTPILRRTFMGKFFKKYLNNFLMEDFDHNSIKEVNWLMGSCLMIDKKKFNLIKPLFDKRFFMYCEDIDLCYRACEAKYKIIYNPKAIIIHDHIRSGIEKPWYISPFLNKLAREHIKSWIKYFWKWK